MWHRKLYSCTLMATVDVKGWNSSGPCTQMFSTLPLMCYYNHSGWLIAVAHWTHTRYIPQRWPVWSPHVAQWKLSLCISMYVCRCVCRELSVSRRRVSMHTRWPTWLESRFTAIPPFHWPTSSSTYELPLMLAVVCPSVCTSVTHVGQSKWLNKHPKQMKIDSYCQWYNCGPPNVLFSDRCLD